MAKGSTLIEVLVSLLLLSIILFGFDAIQIYTQRQVKILYLYGVASQQLTNILSRISSLQNGYLQEEVVEWNKQNRELLPQGRGVISQGVVSIFWGKNESVVCYKNKIDEAGCLRRNFN